MKKKYLKSNFWVAVKIWRGFPESVKTFDTEKAALEQEMIWRKQMNPEYDETGIFKIYKIDRKAKPCLS